MFGCFEMRDGDRDWGVLPVLSDCEPYIIGTHQTAPKQPLAPTRPGKPYRCVFNGVNHKTYFLSNWRNHSLPLKHRIFLSKSRNQHHIQLRCHYLFGKQISKLEERQLFHPPLADSEEWFWMKPFWCPTRSRTLHSLLVWRSVAGGLICHGGFVGLKEGLAGA